MSPVAQPLAVHGSPSVQASTLPGNLWAWDGHSPPAAARLSRGTAQPAGAVSLLQGADPQGPGLAHDAL